MEKQSAFIAQGSIFKIFDLQDFIYRLCTPTEFHGCKMFASNSSGRKLLNGLQRKLFMDDYAYAALATGKLDTSQAGAVYDKLSASLGESPIVARAIPEPDPLPLNSHAAEALTKQYETMLGSPNGSYSNVLNALSSFSPNATQTDLFKDALLYVAIRCETATWIDSETKDRQETLARLTRAMDPAKSAVAMNSYLDVSNTQINEWMLVQEGYRHVFAFRFANNHGLDPIPIMPVLDKIIVDNIGPELSIPKP